MLALGKRGPARLLDCEGIHSVHFKARDVVSALVVLGELWERAIGKKQREREKGDDLLGAEPGSGRGMARDTAESRGAKWGNERHGSGSTLPADAACFHCSLRVRRTHLSAAPLGRPHPVVVVLTHVNEREVHERRLKSSGEAAERGDS